MLYVRYALHILWIAVLYCGGNVVLYVDRSETEGKFDLYVISRTTRSNFFL